MIRVISLYLYLAFLCSTPLFASSLDSLKIESQKLIDFNEKFNLFLEEGNSTYLNNSSYSIQCCTEAKKLAVSESDIIATAKSDYCIARAILIQGDVERSLNILNESIKVFEANNLGIEQGDALSIKAMCLSRIGDTRAGKDAQVQAIKIFELAHDTLRLMKCLINISQDYMQSKEYNYAFDNLARAEKLNKLLKDNINQFYIELNLGELYLITHNYSKALSYFNNSFNIATEEKMTDAFISNLIGLGKTYVAIGRFDMATQKLLIALEKSNEFNLPYEKLETLQQLDNVYRLQNDFELALKYFEQFVALRDSMYSIDRLSRIDFLEKNLEVGKKENELALNKLEIANQTSQIEQQKSQKYGFAGGLIIAFVIMLFVFKSYKDKQKANKIITQQKEEVELKRDEIEEKNKEILDSINYARRIQQALLKSEEKITELLPPHFILFKPKDIVSGDFYWAYEKQIGTEHYLYVATADCTGHGVPGGFMSMLSIAFLNEITGQDKHLSSGQILDQLSHKIIKELGQTGKTGETKDGLDISLCCIKQLEAGAIVDWAGANNPLYIIRKTGEDNDILAEHSNLKNNGLELLEIKGDKQPIGYFNEIRPFKSHSLSLKSGDTLIMSSDGFPDQFGGEKGKKFKYKQFKELLLSINTEPLSKQKGILDETFELWKGKLEQIDDVCIVGITI